MRIEAYAGRSVVPGAADGELLHADVGLSFMGGVDSSTGRVIDTHHPLHGQSVDGKVLARPSGRGSCSGSASLFELLVNRHAPVALIFRADEPIPHPRGHPGRRGARGQHPGRPAQPGRLRAAALGVPGVGPRREGDRDRRDWPSGRADPATRPGPDRLPTVCPRPPVAVRGLRRGRPTGELVVTTSRSIHAKAERAGLVARLEQFGARLVNDTCWCLIGEPVVTPSSRTITTSSAKYAHYGTAAVGRRGFHLRSLAGCVDAACTGDADTVLPAWLGSPHYRAR